MNIKFIVNDYILIWNLLFQASISESFHKMKQKIWVNYKKDYNETYKDREQILKDPKNFIPDNDTIYNIILETKGYAKLKKDSEKYRMLLLSKWDERKKEINNALKHILRFDIKIYHILVISSLFDVVDTTTPKKVKVNTLIWGKRYKNSTKTIIDMVTEIVKKELKDYKKDYREIVDAVVELATINEFATLMDEKTHYLEGDRSLSYLKRQIYPYWLMYLGKTEEEIRECMIRDNIGFDRTRYPYEKQLQKLDLYAFIDFCIRNQKRIVKIEELEIL